MMNEIMTCEAKKGYPPLRDSVLQLLDAVEANAACTQTIYDCLFGTADKALSCEGTKAPENMAEFIWKTLECTEITNNKLHEILNKLGA